MESILATVEVHADDLVCLLHGLKD
jgi:hypothetical protein